MDLKKFEIANDIKGICIGLKTKRKCLEYEIRILGESRFGRSTCLNPRARGVGEPREIHDSCNLANAERSWGSLAKLSGD